MHVFYGYPVRNWQTSNGTHIGGVYPHTYFFAKQKGVVLN